MEQSRPYRPHISRETRLLLITALLSVTALWMLARVRFPDQPAAPNPVQPLLTQLAARPAFNDLAAEITQLHSRIAPLLAGAALRIRTDAALTLMEAGQRQETSASLAAIDPASGLALVRVPPVPVPPPVPWMPADLQQARYLVATDTSTGALSLRPVFVGSLVPTPNPLWPEPIWLTPAGTNLTPGSFVFTTDGLLAGLVVDHAGARAIVPGRAVLTAADQVLAGTLTAPGELGLDVQALTPSLAKATGAGAGVVVSSLDPDGPAAGTLVIGDVIEAFDNEPVHTPLHWKARAARVPPGGPVVLRLRRDGAVREVAIVASEVAATTGTDTLGLQLRNVPGTGSMVVGVTDGSAADRAGLRSGDVITLAGNRRAPSPVVIRRLFDGVANGSAMLVGFTRAGGHAVTALEK